MTDAPADHVARALLGAVLVSRLGGAAVTARVVETEAYLGVADPASHASNGRRTAHNASIYLPPAHWYVYRSYGLHWCANITCGPPGEGQAVLVRAVEILHGVETARVRRGGRHPDRLLGAGPGRLAQALGIDRTLDGRPVAGSMVEVRMHDGHLDTEVAVGPRIGISRAVEAPWRFGVMGARALSRPFRP